MADEERVMTPMRVQLKTDDGTEQGLWLTVFEGWVDMFASGRATDEASALATAIALKQQEGEF